MKNGDVTAIFGEKVFNLPTMRKTLPGETYNAFVKTINEGSKLDYSVAEVVASAMKDWAIKKRLYTLYSLVSANDRTYCRKA